MRRLEASNTSLANGGGRCDQNLGCREATRPRGTIKAPIVPTRRERVLLNPPHRHLPRPTWAQVRNKARHKRMGTARSDVLPALHAARHAPVAAGNQLQGPLRQAALARLGQGSRPMISRKGAGATKPIRVLIERRRSALAQRHWRCGRCNVALNTRLFRLNDTAIGASIFCLCAVSCASCWSCCIGPGASPAINWPRRVEPPINPPPGESANPNSHRGHLRAKTNLGQTHALRGGHLQALHGYLALRKIAQLGTASTRVGDASPQTTPCQSDHTAFAHHSRLSPR